jgi:hypothetical protein
MVHGLPVVQHDGWYCVSEPGEYLGCIDLADKGCGVAAVCQSGKKWLIVPSQQCVPPGFNQCSPPTGDEKEEPC